jgi:hypothetical protein
MGAGTPGRLEAGRRQADGSTAVSEARKGLVPKTPTQRVDKVRDAWETKGLKRWELSPPPHPDDRQAIRDFAA